MNNAKEALLNLKNNKKYYLSLTILYFIVIVILVFSLLIFNIVKTDEELYYIDFTNNCAIVTGSFTTNELESYKNDDYVIYAYATKEMMLTLSNKTTININTNYCSNKLDNSLTPSRDFYNSIEKLNIVYGRDFTNEDINYNLNSIIINESLAVTLFQTRENSIGKELKIDDTTYYIVGVVNDTPSFLRMMNNDEEIYSVFILNKDNDFTFNKLIFNSKKIITTENLENFFDNQDKSINQCYTRESIDDNILLNNNNFDDILTISFVFIGIILIVVFLTILISIRKEEICIKRNLGANFFDLLWEFLFEFMIIFIIIFTLLILPTHLIYWIGNKYIYSLFYLNYELQNCFAGIIKIFGICLLTIISTIIVNLTIIFSKDISIGLKE